MNVSFSGCGFLGVYHLGVAAALRRHVPAAVLAEARFAGASAGALVGAAVAANAPLDPCVEAFLSTATTVRSLWGGAFNPNSKLDSAIAAYFRTVFPANAYRDLRGRHHVSLTELPFFRNRLVTDFESDEEVLDALLCSSYIPGFTAAKPPKFRGRYYVDGGFSDNNPSVPGVARVYTVSPFSGRFDVCPRSKGHSPTMAIVWGYYANTGNVFSAVRALYPPDQAELLKVHHEGYDDACRFLSTTLGLKLAPTVSGVAPFESASAAAQAAAAAAADVAASPTPPPAAAHATPDLSAAEHRQHPEANDEPAETPRPEAGR